VLWQIRSSKNSQSDINAITILLDNKLCQEVKLHALQFIDSYPAVLVFVAKKFIAVSCHRKCMLLHVIVVL